MHINKQKHKVPKKFVNFFFLLSNLISTNDISKQKTNVHTSSLN